jgi:glycosyltransferase involved in cell wall biosynthesis
MLAGSVHLPAYVRSLRRVLRSLAPDVIHSNGFKTHFLSAWTAPTGCPVIWHMHEYARCRPVAARLTRMLSHSAALMLANSNAVAEDLRAVCGAGANIETVYAAVDTQRFSPLGPRLDLDSVCMLPKPERPCVRIGMVATMAKWKGHEVFLRAVARLPRSLPVRAYVIGGPLYSTNGSQRRIQDLQVVANDLGIADRVGFTGYVEDTASAMRALDVIVHASIEPEPFGLVIAEGMACGRAVIAARNAGVSELIRFGVHALDHAPGDDAELAGRISLLVQSADLRRQIGFAARHAAVHSFSGSRLSAQLVETFAAAGPQSLRAAAA